MLLSCCDRFKARLVVIHVFTSLTATLSLIAPLATTKGSLRHKRSGMTAVALITAMYVFGEGTEVLLLWQRGYHPCAFVMRSQSGATSHSAICCTFRAPITGHFSQKRCVSQATKKNNTCTCCQVCYGTLLMVYAKRAMPRALSYMLISLSAIAVTLNIGRVGVLLTIMICNEERGEFGYALFDAALLLLAFVVFDCMASSALSFANCRFVLRSMSDKNAQGSGCDDAWRRRQHGKHLVVVCAIMTWTFVANITGKLEWHIATSVSYVIFVLTVVAYAVDPLYSKLRHIVEAAKQRTCSAEARRRLAFREHVQHAHRQHENRVPHVEFKWRRTSMGKRKMKQWPSQKRSALGSS